MFLKTNIEGLEVRKIRDLSYFRFGENTIALAVDSEGSVGNRPKDQFNRPLEEVVPLMIEVIAKEMICMGGDPIAVYLDFSTQEDDYNKKIEQIIKNTIKEAGYNPDIVKSQYGKYDLEVDFTLMGLSIVGAIRHKVRTSTSKPGDAVYCVGTPIKRFDIPSYIKLKTVKEILSLPYVHEVLPGGSHGILDEAEQLAKTNGLNFVKGDNNVINSQEKESCGGACAVLVSVDAAYRNEFENMRFPNEVYFFGTLEGKPTDSKEIICGSRTECTLNDDGSLDFSDGYRITTSTAMSYGIGNKPGDKTRRDDLDAYGLELTKHALNTNEHQPMAVINNLTFGMEPDGRKEIKAISEYLKNEYPGMETFAEFTGSTEDNMKPEVTAYAIRVLGLSKE